MALKTPKGDREILRHVAEYKIITVMQLSILCERGRQVIRRRIRALAKEGLIDIGMRGYGRGRGRPEELIGLTKKGTQFLAEQGITISQPGTTRQAGEFLFIDHDLLVNWFRIHLIHIDRIVPRLSVKFLRKNSDFKIPISKEHTFTKINRSDKQRKVLCELIPDAVFSITSTASEMRKSLLFFLEVDMGTETISSLSRSSGDIREKVLNYQNLFRTARYKACEQAFHSKFNGFRLLFLANTHARLIALCNLVREMPPSNFIWLSDQERMFSHGLGAKIWFQQGRRDDGEHSILGSKLACESSVRSTVK